MTARKIDAMHARFGMEDGTCKDCPHLISGRYHDRILHKCEAYGLTHSEATDWRLRWVACGLKNLPLPDENPVFEQIRGQREYVSENVPGQIGIEELLEGGERMCQKQLN